MPDVHDVLATPSTNVHDVLATPCVHDVLATDNYMLKRQTAFEMALFLQA